MDRHGVAAEGQANTVKPVTRSAAADNQSATDAPAGFHARLTKLAQPLLEAAAPLDLFGVPHAFTQTPLLGPVGVVRRASDRFVDLDPARLELLHRRGLLVPLFGFDIGRASTETLDWIAAMTYGGWESAAHEDGCFLDTSEVPLDEMYGPGSAISPLYSRFQLLALRNLAPLVEQMRVTNTNGSQRWALSALVEVSAAESQAVEDAGRFRDTAVLLEALSPRYQPRLGGGVWLDARWPPTPLTGNSISDETELFAVDIPAPEDLACGIAEWADTFDPLGEWLRVVRSSSSGMWDGLRGDALLEMEARRAGELVLMHHEALDAGRGTSDLTDGWSRWSMNRLKAPARERENTFMDFGLHAQSAVTLAVEGDTEVYVFSRILDLIAPNWNSGLIQLHNLGGVGKDTGLLSRAVAVPSPREWSTYGFRLGAPLTGLVVAVDPERKYKTEAGCRKIEEIMLNEVLAALDEEYRTPEVRRDLQSLLLVRTWGSHSFELAHFSDSELAAALAALPTAPPAGEIERALADARQRGLDVKRAWSRWDRSPSKPELAAIMWPLLESAFRHGDGGPAFEVATEVRDLAYRLRGVREIGSPDR